MVPRRSVTTCGLPVIGGLLSSPLVVVAWAVGAFRMFAGFSKTTYNDSMPTRVALSALWCARCAALRAHPLHVLDARAATWLCDRACGCAESRVPLHPLRRPVLFAVSAAYRENFTRASS